ncbi:hypothetical protein [Roseibacillus ishigakijimensis]|uniref:Peptidase S54 rhomboid domain-containing protein n=1 Tax=Roseibacillus ishigakijimensis TaxID=454146 RepID=A0A934VN24_9BACT|nr:hypothetical protein [Roseibacillus ishigakijimensis]MBK1834575.1 hypothetical protein [Roseibacillus ishigakijimensis]
MSFLTTLENRLPWLAFPSLLRGFAIIHFVMVLLLMARPDLGIAMAFDWPKIMGGEFWRILSFLFLVDVPHPESVAGFRMLPVLFAFFALLIAFMFNDTLETTWGVWRTSLYFYLVILGQIVANCLLALMGARVELVGGYYLYLAAFFAFATLFPKHTFLLMLIIPVQVWVLAAIAAFFLLAKAAGQPSFFLYLGLTFAPFLAWAIPQWRRAGVQRSSVAKRRVAFESKKKAGQQGSFHLCKVCQATENSHPDRDFRVTAEGDEICSACLDQD